MRVPNYRPQCALVFCLALLLNAQFVTAQVFPNRTPAKVSEAKIVSPGKDNGSVYQEVIHLADLPNLDLSVAPQPALIPATTAIPSAAPALPNPVALASYEEPIEEETPVKTNPTSEPANSISKDPLFTFGGLLPVDEQVLQRPL